MKNCVRLCVVDAAAPATASAVLQAAYRTHSSACPPNVANSAHNIFSTLRWKATRRTLHAELPPSMQDPYLGTRLQSPMGIRFVYASSSAPAHMHKIEHASICLAMQLASLTPCSTCFSCAYVVVELVCFCPRA